MLISRQTPEDVVVKLGSECNRCGHCCKYNTGIVLEEELERIASYLGVSVEELKKNYLEETVIFNKRVFKPKLLKKRTRIGKEEVELPYGQCIFYDERVGCVIHEAKPLYCRIATCKPHSKEALQWFYLNYLVDPHDPNSIREWATYLKFNEPIPGGELTNLVPDEEKLKQIMRFEIINNVQLETERLMKKLDSMINGKTKKT